LRTAWQDNPAWLGLYLFFVVTVPLQQLQMVSEFSTAGVVIGFGRTILEVFFYAFLLRVHLGWIVFVNWFGPNTT
jgi:hypothetical protein